MASVLKFFMVEDDERAFLTDLAPLALELYPVVVPRKWDPPIVGAALAGTLVDPAYYLGVASVGPVQVDKVKRGPDRGSWHVLEVVSPVIHWLRSLPDEDGDLRSGRLWAELEVSGDVQRRIQKSDAFEGVYRRIEEMVRRRARRSDPKGYWVLPHAAKASARGTPLREEGRNGKLVRPFG